VKVVCDIDRVVVIGKRVTHNRAINSHGGNSQKNARDERLLAAGGKAQIPPPGVGTEPDLLAVIETIFNLCPLKLAS
jgi:hypothetical protein